MPVRFILAVLATFVSFAAFSQSLGVSVPPVTNSDSRLIGRLLEPTYTDFSTLSQKEPTVKWELDLGGSYTKTESDARATTGDVEMDATLPAGTILKLITGYGRVRAAGQTVNGLADITMQVVQPLTPVGQGALLAAVGVKVPSGTDVSANHASQSAALYYVRPLGEDWRMLAVAQGSHTNTPLPDSVSRQAYSGVVRFVYRLDEKFSQNLWVQYVGSHRSGTTTFQGLSAAYERSLKEDLGLRLVASRGLSKGSKDTGGSFTLIWSF